jgi:hypothetical protein
MATSTGWSRRSVADRRSWDAAVNALGGSVLQSWAWGEWYQEGGFRVERVRVDGPGGTGLAQVLVWPHGPVREGHLARGPVIGGDAEAVTRELIAAIDDVCDRYRPLALTVESPAPLPPPGGTDAVESAEQGERWCCPGRSVLVPLLDDATLLQRMRPDKRHRIRQAQRAGITVEQREPNTSTLESFYVLLQETAARNQFAIEPLAYYQNFLRALGDKALLLFAQGEAGIAAGAIITCFGNEATYHFGASSTDRRAHGATVYLQYEAMRLARRRGCTFYDLWGIPDEDPPPVTGDETPGSRGGDWSGLHHFKLGLGGDIVTYPSPFVRFYQARG